MERSVSDPKWDPIQGFYTIQVDGNIHDHHETENLSPLVALVEKKLLKMFPQMKIESTPSSSSNHVVLQRLTSKTEKRGEDGELPRIGEDDIDNVIGSRNILDRPFYFIILMFLQLQFGLIYDYFPSWIPGRRNI